MNGVSIPDELNDRYEWLLNLKGIVPTKKFKTYVIINHSNGKLYIGYTSQDTAFYRGSQKNLTELYRDDNFDYKSADCIVIQDFDNETDAYTLEATILCSKFHNYLTGKSLTYNRYAGGHIWKKRPDGTSLQTDRVNNTTHNFLTKEDGSNFQYELVAAGKHPWQTRIDGTSHATDKVKNGTHPFMTRPDGSNLQTDMVEKGIHPLQRRIDGTSHATDKVAAGTHHFLQSGYNSPTANKEVWKKSQLIYNIFTELSTENYTPGYKTLYKECINVGIINDSVTPKTLTRILRKFHSGWIPEQDPDFIKFKSECN